MIDLSLSYHDGTTLEGADAILEQYEIALFTVPGEFSPDPDFGIGIGQQVSEVNNEANAKALRQYIINQTEEQFEEIEIRSINIVKNTAGDTLSIQMEIYIIPHNANRTLYRELGNG